MAQQNMNAVFYATTYHPIQAGSIDGTDTAPHDNAVYRALLAASTGLYDPTGDQKAEGDPYKTLFIGRLAHHTTEKTIHEAMSKYGKVKHLRLVRDIVTGASRGYAFVEFECDKDMLYAYEMGHHSIIDGSQILVDYNRQQLMPGWIPRRLGGGLGGRKESGQLRFGGRDRPFRAPLRTIPDEQLIKLGIPLPPVGRYMSRFQLPPIPRRSECSKEVPHHRRRVSQKRVHSLETLPAEIPCSDEEVEIAQQSRSLDQPPETPLRLGRSLADVEKGSSTWNQHRNRHAAGKVLEDYLPKKGESTHEDQKQHKKRSRYDHVEEQRSARSDHKDRESTAQNDRSRSSSWYNDRGNSLCRKEKAPMSSSAEHERSPKHGREESKPCKSKDRRRDIFS